MNHLYASWQRVSRNLALDLPDTLYQQLLAAWVEPQRHYHSLQHLQECLAQLDAVLEQAQPQGRARARMTASSAPESAMRLLPLLLLSLSLPVMAAEPVLRPAPILPQEQRWMSPPQVPGLSAAWLLGSEQGSAAYALRVKLAPGTRIPVHTHPDTRSTTVLSGTLYVGFGAQFDESALVAIPAGALYVAPAGVAHYLWAKDGEVLY